MAVYNVNKSISSCNKNKYHTTTSIDFLPFIRSSIQNMDKINIDCKSTFPISSKTLTHSLSSLMYISSILISVKTKYVDTG